MKETDEERLKFFGSLFLFADTHSAFVPSAHVHHTCQRFLRMHKIWNGLHTASVSYLLIVQFFSSHLTELTDDNHHDRLRIVRRVSSSQFGLEQHGSRGPHSDLCWLPHFCFWWTVMPKILVIEMQACTKLSEQHLKSRAISPYLYPHPHHAFLTYPTSVR